jgi:hypothetical protein
MKKNNLLTAVKYYFYKFIKKFKNKKNDDGTGFIY